MVASSPCPIDEKLAVDESLLKDWIEGKVVKVKTLPICASQFVRNASSDALCLAFLARRMASAKHNNANTMAGISTSPGRGRLDSLV